MAAAARAWMYEKPRDWDRFLPGVNGFLDQAEAYARISRGVEDIICPCVDCGNEKLLPKRDNVFVHLITRGFIDGYTCWSKHGEEGLNEVEAGCCWYFLASLLG